MWGTHLIDINQDQTKLGELIRELNWDGNFKRESVMVLTVDVSGGWVAQ
jgi:hypothetical protein